MSLEGNPVWHTVTAKEALDHLAVDREGLDEREVAERLGLYGPNVVARGQQVRWWPILAHQFASPLIYILGLALVVTLAIRHWTDAGVIGFVLALNAVIGFVQERRAENAMQALLSMLAPKATVRRNGAITDVASSDLVPGDIILLESGDLVPADGRLLEVARLEIDEASLTGESLPVSKHAAPIQTSRDVPLGDRRNMVFLGTTVATGRGEALVVETGARTQVGSIAEVIRESRRVQTPLQERMARFGKRIGLAVLATSLAAFLIGTLRGFAATDMFLIAVGITVAAIPEGLPVVMTVALAVGMERMAKRNAIVRRLAAVETLGSCDIIVSDKTGTLTQNQMTVQAIWAGGRRYDVSGSGLAAEGAILHRGDAVDATQEVALSRALTAGALANEATIRWEAGLIAAQGDPTDLALLVAANKLGISKSDLSERFLSVEEIPFEPIRRFAATFRKSADGECVFVKGSPERVVEMCRWWQTQDEVRLVDESVAAEVHAEAQRLAQQGMRVLGMAFGEGIEVLASARASEPKGLIFLGLQGMLDPPRPEAIPAIESAQAAGIRLIMVTGDHIGTAKAIARMTGLANEETSALTGTELDAMDDVTLEQELRAVGVVARASPTQKLRIVNMLRSMGHVVAVTGDGVNDAPALKAAHIGAAMGQTGTDVAKEASDIVLTDDNFASVYAAVEEGRTSFSNIRKATFFLVSAGAGQVIALLASLLLGLPLPFLPAQLIWMNLVTNGIQDVALAFEPPEAKVLRRRPRSTSEGMLSRVLWERTLVAGISLAVGTLFVFDWALDQGYGLAYSQVAALTTAIMFQMVHVGNARSEDMSIFRKNPMSNRLLFFGALVALGLHIGATYFTPTQAILGLQPLDGSTWVRACAVALLAIPTVEAHKLLRRTANS